jgi:hypothetical protein
MPVWIWARLDPDPSGSGPVWIWARLDLAFRTISMTNNPLTAVFQPFISIAGNKRISFGF